MDAISQTQTATSADAVTRILLSANEAVMKQAEKLMKLAVSMKVGMESGKGQNLDVSG